MSMVGTPLGRVGEARAALSAVGGLASAADIGRRHGVTRQRAHQWVHEPGFPDEAARIDNKPVYLVAEADRWLELRSVHLALAARPLR